MKQTAVEWFSNELYEKFEMLGDGILYAELIEKAKEMEKQQMKDMFENGSDYGFDCYHSNEWAVEPTSPNFEQYYNETYKNTN